MPPIRTITSTKPIKTERTHEENQERAYIAASRRSDRSLEARIESARRASEIHKRRTGRSLRVTEQDVVNEEMYEEEDDDLPMQYRRLTAHLDTNSADFNRRLAAYLTNHVAMRSALSQAISSANPAQPQSTQQWPSNGHATPQSLQSSWPHPSAQYSNGVVPPQMLHRPSTSQNQYQPYPSTFNQRTQARTNSQSSAEMRRPSIILNSNSAVSQDVKGEARRGSSQSMAAPPARQQSDSNLARRSASTASPQTLKASPSPDDSEQISTISNSGDFSSGHDQSMGSLASQYTSYQQGWEHMSPGPLTTAMPLETQMYFSGGNGFNTDYDLFGTAKLPTPRFQDTFDKSNFSSYPYLSGMSQTLAPGAMDNEAMNWHTPTSVTDSDFSSGNNYAFGSSEFDNDMFSRPMMNTYGFGSGQITPADNDWSSYINTSSWEETP